MKLEKTKLTIECQKAKIEVDAYKAGGLYIHRTVRSRDGRKLSHWTISNPEGLLAATGIKTRAKAVELVLALRLHCPWMDGITSERMLVTPHFERLTARALLRGEGVRYSEMKLSDLQEQVIDANVERHNAIVGN